MANSAPKVMKTLTELEVSDSTLQDLILYKSTLHNTDLRNVTLYRSTLNNCTLLRCQIVNCKIIDSNLSFSTIVGSGGIRKCKLENTEVRSPTPTLLRLPMEIRESIFKLCLEWNDEAPPLIVALRTGPQELYHEALDVCNKINYFTVHSGNIQSVKNMPDRVLARIWNLQLQPSLTYGWYDASQINRFSPIYLKYDTIDIFPQAVVPLVENIFRHSYSIKVFIVTYFAPKDRPDRSRLNSDLPLLHSRLGVTGIVDKEVNVDSYVIRTLKWTAPPGEVLTWHDIITN